MNKSKDERAERNKNLVNQEDDLGFMKQLGISEYQL